MTLNSRRSVSLVERMRTTCSSISTYAQKVNRLFFEFLRKYSNPSTTYQIMTEEMNSTVSCKWTMEEREKMLTTGTLEQQREAFKDDEELMRETSKFVSEVIQTAITEASKRKVLTEKAVSEGSRLKGIGSVAGWNHRARGFCSRILNALCPCFTSNELFTWTPYRYRFTRP